MRRPSAHALRAFEVSALDYLVKPIDPRRLASTVSRLLARERDTVEAADAGGPVETSFGIAASSLRDHHRVFVSEGERCWLVELRRIRLFEASGSSTRLFFGGETPLINRSLHHLEAKLDGRTFFRANRHQIVNLNAIRAIRPWFGGRLLVEIDGGHEVTLSRRRARAFRELTSV